MAYISPATYHADVGNMMAAMQKPGMVIMQSQQATLASGQQVWVQAMPNAATARPAFQSVPQPQPQQHVTILKQQAVPTQTMRVVQMGSGMQMGSGVQLQPQAQPQLVLQAAPQQPQPQVQAPAPDNVVYVNVNGALQRGVVQNGSVYLLNNSSHANAGGGVSGAMPVAATMVQGQRYAVAPQQQQQQPMTITLAGPGQQPMAAGPQPGGSPMSGSLVQLPNGSTATLYQQAQQPQQVAGGQQMLVQQVGGGTRLVPVSQALSAPPARMQQVLPQQQLSRPMMTVALPAGGSAGRPVMMMQNVAGGGGAPLVQSSGPMVFAAAAPRPQQQMVQQMPQQMVQQMPQQMVQHMPQQMVQQMPYVQPQQMVQAVQAPMPMQQLVPRGPAARPVAMPQPQPMLAMQQQPMGAAGMGPVAMSSTVPNGAVAAAAAAAATAATTQSSAAFRPVAAGGQQVNASGTSVSANTAALMSKVPASATMAAAPGQAQQQQVMMMNGQQQMQLVIPASGPMHGLMDAQGEPSQLARPGGMSSPPAPPATPGMGGTLAPPAAAVGERDGGATDASMLRSHSSGLLGAIGSQRRSKDGAPQAAAAAPGTALPPTSSPVGSAAGSQPGTPARSNSGGGSAPGGASSATSLPLAAAGCAEAGAASSGDKDKAAVMRMMAGSFIETGIGLEAALAMVQPADRSLLVAAFEESRQQQTAPAAAHGSCDTGLASPGKQGGGDLPGLSDLGGVRITMLPQQQAAAKGPLVGGAGGFGFGDACSSDTTSAFDNGASLGSWGFSLFAGGGGASAGAALTGADALGQAGSDVDKLSVDAVVAKPSAPFAAGSAAPKDFALTSMIAALNL